MAATIEEALIARLKGDPTLSAIVGTRIAPWKQRQGTAFPNLIYRRVSTNRPMTQGGFCGLEQARFKLDFWSATGQAEVNSIREALLRQGVNIPGHFLDGHRGDWSGIFVQMSKIEDVGDSPDLPQFWDDTGLYGGSVDLVIWFER